MPNMRIVQIEGAGPLDGDMPFIGSLYMASQPRALLENIARTKTVAGVSRSVGAVAIEKRLIEVLRVRGVDALNAIRDHARIIAPALGLQGEFSQLDRLIGSLLRTHTANLVSPVARSYANGEPYDGVCLERLDTLRSALADSVLPLRQANQQPNEAFYNEGFFDAYFSNFIEGTEFQIDEAIDIIFHGLVSTSRPDDAHDIIGTYRVVGDYKEMQTLPHDSSDFLVLLKRRHFTILESRFDKKPGEFKDLPNQAGSTIFVAPDLVVGTLKKGFELYQTLQDCFARALFMMFLVSEVHPFNDGNGRIARAMMNAELIANRCNRVIVPSVYRNEYIASLKRMTNHNDPSAFVRVMGFAQEFVSRINFENLKNAVAILDACNAFEKPSDSARLKMP
jgi:hypothetical protein